MTDTNADPPTEVWLASDWARILVGALVIAYWAGIVFLLGNLGMFPRNTEATILDAALWVGIGVAGFGIFAAVLLIHAAPKVPLVPGWTLTVLGSLSALALLFTIGSYDGGPNHTWNVGSFIGPPLIDWPSYLSFVTTVLAVLAAVMYRWVSRFRRVSGTVAVLAAVLPYPLLVVAVVVGGELPFPRP